MARIHFVRHDGETLVVEGRTGGNLMELAVKTGVPGIDGDCGGACACATCHIYVGDAWLAAVGPQNAMEQAMLEFAEDVRETSRLACQIRIEDALDGLKIHLPEHQH